MESLPEQVIGFYCSCEKMENFIKEAKSDFEFSAVSGQKKAVNANRLLVNVLTYNLFNLFRRLVLPARMKKIGRYSYETAEDRCKSDPFSKIYNIQVLQQLSLQGRAL